MKQLTLAVALALTFVSCPARAENDESMEGMVSVNNFEEALAVVRLWAFVNDFTEDIETAEHLDLIKDPATVRKIVMGEEDLSAPVLPVAAVGAIMNSLPPIIKRLGGSVGRIVEGVTMGITVYTLTSTLAKRAEMRRMPFCVLFPSQSFRIGKICMSKP